MGSTRAAAPRACRGTPVARARRAGAAGCRARDLCRDRRSRRGTGAELLAGPPRRKPYVAGCLAAACGLAAPILRSWRAGNRGTKPPPPHRSIPECSAPFGKRRCSLAPRTPALARLLVRLLAPLSSPAVSRALLSGAPSGSQAAASARRGSLLNPPAWFPVALLRVADSRCLEEGSRCLRHVAAHR